MQIARRGRASVAICSAAFTTLARAQARALGHAGLPIAVIPHPFGVRSRDEVRALAGTCIEDVVKLATGGAHP